MKFSIPLERPEDEGILYVAGAFSANRASGSVTWNVAIAQRVSLYLIQKGYTVISPHMNFGWLAMEEKQPSWQVMLEHCLKVLARCDHLVLAPMWRHSKGAIAEYNYAKLHHLPYTEVSLDFMEVQK